jgi:hypothetical protein
LQEKRFGPIITPGMLGDEQPIVVGQRIATVYGPGVVEAVRRATIRQNTQITSLSGVVQALDVSDDDAALHVALETLWSCTWLTAVWVMRLQAVII